MRNTLVAILCCLGLLFSILLATGCAPGGGKGGATLTQDAVAQAFVEHLFAGRLDQAKALAAKGHADELKASVDAFAPLLATYQFQEVQIASYRPWSFQGDPEGNRRVEVRYQFKAKSGDDEVKIGFFEFRVLNVSGGWGAVEIVLKRPTE